MSLESTPLMEFANSVWQPLVGQNQFTIVQDNAVGAGQRSSSFTAEKTKREVQHLIIAPRKQSSGTSRRPRSSRKHIGDGKNLAATPYLPLSPPRTKRVPRRSRWESRPSNENLSDKPTPVGSPQQPRRQSTLEQDVSLPRQPQRQLSPLSIKHHHHQSYQLRANTVTAHTA